MGAMNTSRIMKNLLKKLEEDFPLISFREGEAYYWSPSERTVYYTGGPISKAGEWSLLHEVSHGALGHSEYKSDFELLKLESEAWEYAKKLSSRYKIIIDPEHIQDCLDTYRDWLYGRSTCPTCKIVTSQKTAKIYECFNCKSAWQVSNSKFCRPYRLTLNTSK